MRSASSRPGGHAAVKGIEDRNGVASPFFRQRHTSMPGRDARRPSSATGRPEAGRRSFPHDFALRLLNLGLLSGPPCFSATKSPAKSSWVPRPSVPPGSHQIPPGSHHPGSFFSNRVHTVSKKIIHSDVGPMHGLFRRGL